MKYAEQIIKLEEGCSLVEYHCSEGYRTIGYGQKLSDIKYEPLGNTKQTQKETLLFLRKRIDSIAKQLMKDHPIAWSMCNEAQQSILISMSYQLGNAGVNAFRNMWKALDNHDFSTAANEMLNSKWAKQTPNRAKRHANTMRNGMLDMYYVSQGVFQ